MSGSVDPKQQKKALRATMRRLRQENRARVRALLAERRPESKTKKRIVRALVVFALILLALLARCDCGDGVKQAAAPEPVVHVPPVKPPPSKKKASPPKRSPLDGSLAGRQRNAYEVPPPTPKKWLDDFRLQVTARSPRLAACFSGSDRPGALRWTASVEPSKGAVSDHGLEPIGLTGELPQRQRSCLIAVLSNPPYRLKTDDEESSTPQRVGIVIEF